MNVEPDPNCEICSGTGVAVREGARRECTCVLRKRAQHYLTPVYTEAKWRHDHKVDPWLRNVLYVGDLSTFKSHVKSVLLNTGMKYTHETVTPQDVVDRFVSSDGRESFNALRTADVLCLVFITDPRNREYERLLSYVIDSRHMTGRFTWVYSERPPANVNWTQLYGDKLAQKITTAPFAKLSPQ